jgi:LmbE family N-acetylglucosaminyl deacetylase
VTRGARWILLAVWLPLVAPGGLAAQQALGPTTGGTVALRQAERMLGHTKRVLMIAAHPDDEDTELLTVLVRGQGAEAAYLSLSRGEGGQNLIGPELGEALGLIRTEELLGARALDGARQYFTRAFDFGFSKNIEETSRFWPRDSVLKDVVRIVRRFQPQIIISIFSGTPRDGHGQHQMAGWAAQEAFKVAGDPARYPELQREEGSPRGPRQALSLGTLRRRRRVAYARWRRAGSRYRAIVSPGGDAGTQPASLPGHGGAAGARAVRDPAGRADRSNRREPTVDSGAAWTPRQRGRATPASPPGTWLVTRPTPR